MLNKLCFNPSTYKKFSMEIVKELPNITYTKNSPFLVITIGYNPTTLAFRDKL